MNGMKIWHNSRFWLGITLAALITLAGCGEDSVSSRIPGGGGSEFFTYNLDGAGDVTVTQALPESCLAGGYLTDTTVTGIFGWDNLSTTSEIFEIDFSGNTTGTGLTPVNVSWWDSTIIAGYDIGTMNVTSYDGVGGSIVGDFNFVIFDTVSVTHTFTGSFSVTRISDSTSGSPGACS